MTFNNKRTFALIALLLTAVIVLTSFTVFAAGEANEPSNFIPTESEKLDVDGLDEPTEVPTEISVVAPTEDPTQAPSVGEISGDVDGSGAVDINDVTYLQMALVGKQPKTEHFKKTGDTNTDGKITIYDATVIQMYIAGRFKMLPVTNDGYYAHIYRP